MITVEIIEKVITQMTRIKKAKGLFNKDWDFMKFG